MFLRNLCRVVRIPTFVSGTDSNVAKMVGGSGSNFESRVDEGETKGWVNVNVKTSPATLQSFAKLVKFKKYGETKPTGCLNSYILNNTNELKYEDLLSDICGRAPNRVKLEWFKNIANFLINQSETSLPGIIALVFSWLLALVPAHSNAKELWEKLAEKFSADISARKKNILIRKFGLLASSFILSFPSLNEEDEEGVGSGRFSAKLVENHLFYYGTPDDITFQLDLQLDDDEDDSDEDDDENYEENIVIIRNGLKYTDKCHFPELNEDFFTTFACLNMWSLGVMSKDKTGKKRWTMANLYENYLNQIHKYNLGIKKTVQKSFSLELLSYWSICRASHQNANGRTSGVDAFWEFVKNLQKSKDSEGNLRTIKFTDSGPLNTNLKNILDKIEVPYLMRFPDGSDLHQRTRNELLDFMGEFIKVGEASIPRD